MFWVSETQTAQYDNTVFSDGEKWSHFLYNIGVWAPGDPPGMEERVRKGARQRRFKSGALERQPLRQSRERRFSAI